MRILIVDDEALAREAVRMALGRLPGVDVVGEARDGVEAVAAIDALAPDLVFLDVQMPGVSGVEALLAIAPERRPGVVFVTAHEQFAIRAFELDAVDYVLKPFDDERIHAALERARRRLDGRARSERPDAERLEAVLRRLAERETTDRWQQRPGGSGPPLNLTAREAGEAASAAGARRLLLTHFWPGNDRDRSRAEAAAVFPGPVLVADEGAVVALG